MEVIQAEVISAIPNPVLPIAPLPDAALALDLVADADPFAFRQAPAEPGLDQPPAGREIGIALGQGPDRVEMVRQHHHRVDAEGPLVERRADGPTQ